MGRQLGQCAVTEKWTDGGKRPSILLWEVYFFVHDVVGEVGGGGEEADDLHFHVAGVLEHVDGALREEDGGAFVDGGDLSGDQDAAGASDDVDDFLSVGMTVGGPHLLARGNADYAGRALFGRDTIFRYNPAEMAAGQI
jgi:hypothetical protein